MKSHGLSMSPPWQPSSEAPKHTSCAESGTIAVAFVAMHKRSEAAEAAPNAQQQPHIDWSRISPITFAQCGQFVSESKLSGMAIEVKGCLNDFANAARLAIASGVTPARIFRAPPWSFVFFPAVQ